MGRYLVAFIVLMSLLVSCAQAQTFSPEQSSVFFGGDPVGGAPQGGARRIITIDNKGTSPLVISGWQFNPPELTGGFFVPADLFILPPLTAAAGSSTTITIEFDAQAAGPQSATISFTDNAPGSPHTIPLSGLGLTNDFSLAIENPEPPTATTPTTVTVKAGQVAGWTFDLAAGPNFSGMVTIDCTGLPANSHFQPLFHNADGTPGSPNFSVAGPSFNSYSAGILTAGPTGALDRHRTPWWYALGFTLVAGLLSIRGKHRAVLLVVVFGIAAVGVSCGGGSTSSANGGPTPPGTYQVTFTASSGGTVHSVPATLVVQ